jgi:uncharacterized RDD family membrane protein YckC
METAANPYAPPRARVRDVAPRRVALVPAERSTRLGAAIVDNLIFTGFVYGPLLAGSISAGAFADAGGTEILAATIAVVFGAFIVWSWLTIRQLKATGQSLAKKYFNIKVVHADGSQPTLGNLIWKRNGITWILSLIPLYAFVEVLFIFGEDRQCLHDKIAGTIVVQA